MTRSATKYCILSATAHVGLVLTVMALCLPATVAVSKPHQSAVLLVRGRQQKQAASPPHVARRAISQSEVLGTAALSMKSLHAESPAQVTIQSLTPPELETELPLQYGDGMSGLFGLESAGNGGSVMPPPYSCRAQIDPVEILSKPIPAYSLEARELYLEGDVSLEVVFRASGDIRLVGVTHGLGHGLDEAAIAAAKQIRFKPASCAGIAMVVNATIHVEFRLGRRQQPTV